MFGAKAQRASLLSDFCNKICQHRTRAPQQMRSLFGDTLKRDHQYKLSPIDIPAMADGSPQLF